MTRLLSWDRWWIRFGSGLQNRSGQQMLALSGIRLCWLNGYREREALGSASFDRVASFSYGARMCGSRQKHSKKHHCKVERENGGDGCWREKATHNGGRGHRLMETNKIDLERECSDDQGHLAEMGTRNAGSESSAMPVTSALATSAMERHGRQMDGTTPEEMLTLPLGRGDLKMTLERVSLLTSVN